MLVKLREVGEVVGVSMILDVARSCISALKNSWKKFSFLVLHAQKDHAIQPLLVLLEMPPSLALLLLFIGTAGHWQKWMRIKEIWKYNTNWGNMLRNYYLCKHTRTTFVLTSLGEICMSLVPVPTSSCKSQGGLLRLGLKAKVTPLEIMLSL